MQQLFLRNVTRILFTMSLMMVSLSIAVAQTKPQYRKNVIRDARFGDDQKQAQISKAYELDKLINAEIFGQEHVAVALRDKLVQYLEGFGQRKDEPVAVNLMGLPGIGKSAMLKILAKAGVYTMTFDAQKYTEKVSSRSISFADELAANLVLAPKTGPRVLVIEELDKLPEIDSATGAEKTENLIGTVNQILADGKLKSGLSSAPLDLSNIMVITTMNLAPQEITKFSKEALGEDKTFYDFTVSDFQKFHEWVLSHQAAVPKLLSSLFRSNTVSRLAPISVLVKPLGAEDYRKVVEKTMKTAITRATTGENAKARLEISYSDKVIDFLNERTAYAPSGARNSVMKTDILMEQLINYSKRASGGDSDTLLVPRKIHFDFDESTQSIRVVVTPLKTVNNKELRESKGFELHVQYSAQTGQFIQPDDIAKTVAKAPSKITQKEDVILKKDVKAMRFPPKSRAAKGLADYINQGLFGQEEFSKLMESELNQYMVRPDDAPTAPPGVVFAGFPGIGKSEMMRLTAEYLEIPVIKVNLQQYTSDTNESVAGLFSHINGEVEKLRMQGKNKYILLLEELDKIFEIDPKGNVVNRPVMSIVKDLLNNGQSEMMMGGRDGDFSKKISLDVRDAFIGITMNFSVDRFDFKADPRLTTVEDVLNAWKRLSTRLSDLKQLLGSMFLPETVNRLISKVNILKPLSEQDYKKVIESQVQIVIEDRFTDSNYRDIGLITVELTPAYKKYLFNESVVPSEGARFAANVSRSLINLDVEALTRKIPKLSPFSAKPLVFTLDYKSGKRMVVGSISKGKRKSDVLAGVYSREADLNFPPLGISGKVPKDRLITSLHEFGHAFASVRGGSPFESIVVVPPSNGVGGYVKNRSNPHSADELISQLFSGLGSRAMERIMLSSNPTGSTAVADITAGPSSDILQVTKTLFAILKELGFDPAGGVMDRRGIEGMSRYANFADLPHDVVESMGLVLRDIEDALVKDFLALHKQDWYAEKIKTLARRGSMSERQFYELLELNYPGDGWQRVDADSMIFKHFKGQVKEKPVLTPASNFVAYKTVFLNSVKTRMHPVAALPGITENKKATKKSKNQNGKKTCATLLGA